MKKDIIFKHKINKKNVKLLLFYIIYLIGHIKLTDIVDKLLLTMFRNPFLPLLIMGLNAFD